MVVIPNIPICFSIDFVAKTFSFEGVTFGKACTLLGLSGLSINPFVGLIIGGALALTTILTWIYRKQIIKFLKAAIEWITGKDIDIK